MDPSIAPYREVALPVSALRTVRDALTREAGSLQAIHTLHAAGHASGVEAVAAFKKSADEELADLPEDVFWSRLIAFLAERGWGTLTRSAPHPGIGLLSSDDWAECGDVEPDPDRSCSFTTGFLSGLLTRLSGGPIAVLEVDCRGRGDGHCAFAFGAEGAVHELYGLLLDSSDLDAALARL